MGADELSPTLRRATNWCLERNDEIHQIPLTVDNLAVAAQRSHKAVMLFLTGSAYFECSVDLTPGGELTGAVGSEPGCGPETGCPVWSSGCCSPPPRWTAARWRSAVGSVSRVRRLVLEHGDGRQTRARLTNGAFGLVSRGDVTDRAELVGYDREGREIVRQLLFPPDEEQDRCYTAPDGTVVYGKADQDCRPAEPWGF
ncbi:hypothetical protein [Plantactinospora sp. B5E13]|uniref:hypothetical protein n=1 Tax=unclassified Plantactinospora TaxID=2631981 RepID=UPI00325E36D0